MDDVGQEAGGDEGHESVLGTGCPVRLDLCWRGCSPLLKRLHGKAIIEGFGRVVSVWVVAGDAKLLIIE